MPRRIQQRRIKGSSIAPAISVTRGNHRRWGNPYVITGEDEGRKPPYRIIQPTGQLLEHEWATKAEAAALAVALFTEALIGGRLRITVADVITNLAGHDLACFCPLDQPCHADVLLELANSAN